MRRARRAQRFSIGRWVLLVLAGWLLFTVSPVLLLRFVDPPTTAFIEQRKWEASQKNEKGFVLRWQWVPRSRISVHLQRALIAAEDQNFFAHQGFDVQAIEDAMEDRREGKSSRGASTLTQQVAKNLFLWPGRNFIRKGLEAYFAVLIETLWPKHRILEMHLNVAEYGNGVYGVEQASRMFLGKSAAAVSAEEAAQLVVVLPNPKARRVSAPSPQMSERSEWVLEQMQHLRVEGL